jgi:hypothetical protein
LRLRDSMPCACLDISSIRSTADSQFTSCACQPPHRLLTISTPDSQKPLDPKPHVHPPTLISEHPTVRSPSWKARESKSSWRERPLPARLKQERASLRLYESTSHPQTAPCTSCHSLLIHLVFTAGGRLLAALLQVPGKTCSRSLKVNPLGS